MNNFAKNLKSYREQAGLTQKDLGEALKMSYQAVSHWETKLTEPDINMLIKIANFFKITLDELIRE